MSKHAENRSMRAGGISYHVTQRGNRRGDVFFCDEDCVRYLGWLLEYAERYMPDCPPVLD